MDSSGSVLVVGSLNADLVVRVERMPQPGETVAGSELAILPGGKGANQAVASALLGSRTTMLGAVGQDAHGDLLISSLAQAGVEVDTIRRVPKAATGTAVISVDADGENSIIVSPGANAHLTEGDVAASGRLFASCEVVCLCLEIPLPVTMAAAAAAHRAGKRVIVNLSPYGPVPPELLAMTSLLLVNEHEAEALFGTQEPGPNDLHAHGIDCAVITLGARGAFAVDAAGRTDRVGAPAVRAVDTTGCGDAFTGAMASRLAAGDELAQAARFAATVGALAATKMGAQSSYPRLAEVRAMLG